MSSLQYSFEQFVSYLIRKCHNDTILFFVEDKKMDGIYERLFQKLFPHKQIKIINSNKLSTLLKGIDQGGKDELIEFHKKLLTLLPETLEKINYRFLIDPDFQLYFNKPLRIKHDNVCYLDRYCIENYLIDEESIIKTVQSYFPDKSYSKITQTIDIQHWINEIPEIFGELFSYFAFNYINNLKLNKCIVTKSEISMQNINFFFGNSYKLDKQKIKLYYKCLKKNYLLIDSNFKKQDIHDFTKVFLEKVNEVPSKLISGKYLFHSLHNYLRIEKNIRIIPKDKNLFKNNLYSTMIDNHSVILFEFLK